MNFVRAFLRAPSGVLGALAILALAGIAIVAPLTLSEPATLSSPFASMQNPSPEHPFGTDRLGRDLLARMLVAARLSLGMGVVAELFAFAIGVPIGAAVAVLSPSLRRMLMRAIDGVIAFPSLLISIYVVTVLGPTLGLIGLAVALAIPASFRTARVVSTLALSIAGRDYLHAARVVGVKGPQLILRHVLPNMAEVLLISLAVGVSGSILAFSGLSFLGLGVQPPDFDWGRMLTEGVAAFYLTPVGALGPLLFIVVTASAFTFVGEALARAANPVLWTFSSAKSAGTSEPSRSRATNAAPFDALASDPLSSPLRAANGILGASPVLKVNHLNVDFPTGVSTIRIVSDVSFTVDAGEVLGIVGESGSGKTMTALSVAGLVPYPGRVTGEISLLGRELRELSDTERATFLGTEMAMVFQDPMTSLNPALTIATQMTEAARRHRRLTRAAATSLAMTRLGEVNLHAPELQMLRHPHELSGGMRQRVMIAMGLMNDPKLLICDEPTTALDVTIQAQIMDLLAKVNTEHRTAVILISHNLALVRQHCARVLVMYAGRIVEELPAERLLDDALHPYTRALLAVVPDIAQPEDITTLPSIQGSVPDATQLPDGCAFHPRCPLAMEVCRKERPPLVTRADGRRVACWASQEGGGSELEHP